MGLMQIHLAAASRTLQVQQWIEALDIDPLDADAQAKIAERIRLPNVQKNMEIAIEVMADALARFTCCT